MDMLKWHVMVNAVPHCPELAARQAIPDEHIIRKS